MAVHKFDLFVDRPQAGSVFPERPCWQLTVFVLSTSQGKLHWFLRASRVLSSGRQFNRKQFCLEIWLENGLRFLFDSVTCVNYSFYQFSLCRESQAKSQAIVQAKNQAINFLLNRAPAASPSRHATWSSVSISVVVVVDVWGTILVEFADSKPTLLYSTTYTIHMLIALHSTVHPSCMVHSFVLQKLTLQAGWPYIRPQILAQCPFCST